jgi:DNA-binding transcriptional ArsR family regulator
MKPAERTRKKMDAQTRALFEARARVIKAMAHPTRLFIVDQLSQIPEKCVCELTEMIGADMSTVSKHLAVLKNAGILQDQKRGAQVYYTLRVPCVMKFFECVESVIQCNVEEQRKLVT